MHYPEAPAPLSTCFNHKRKINKRQHCCHDKSHAKIRGELKEVSQMPNRKLNKEVAYIQVKISPEEKDAFDAWCAANSTTMSAVIRQEIEQYIKRGRHIRAKARAGVE